MATIRRAALYARVSTDDKGQDPELQPRDLRAYAAAKGWDAAEYVDYASAADMRGRAEWRRMLDDAARGRLDILLVVKLDRAARSAYDAFTTLRHLEAPGVAFRAVDQPELAKDELAA
jgi:DNA invertase Pin-like site-specific DNA recombinase